MQTKQSQSKQASQKSPTRISTNESTSAIGFEGDLALVVQRAIHAPSELSPRNISFLQRTLGNRAIGKLLQQRNLSPSHTALKSISALQRTPAEDIINEQSSWGNLHEDQLGAVLLDRVKQGEYAFVQQVFNELDSVDRDDVAFELIRRADDHVLTQIGTTSSGRSLLDRFFDELTSGSVASEEQEQADRILSSKTRRIDPEQFQKGMKGAKIFPYRLPGFTVLDAAPIRAERRGTGRVWVKQPVAVLGTDMFDNETRTLPDDVFTSGIELPEDEIIGVKMYDLGGAVHYRPALYLVQLANETDTTTLSKIGEAIGIGLTLGTGTLAGLGIEATMAARVLLWADRAAFALGTITSIIREHRGWIIERFGSDGREFLRYVDMVHSASAIYGFARVAISMGQIINELRIAYQNWRSAVRIANSQLNQNERNIIQQTNQQVDDVLNQSNDIQNARQQGTTTGQSETSGETQIPTNETQQAQQSANDPHQSLVNTLKQRQQQITQSRGDLSTFQNTFRRLSTNGNTQRSIDEIAPQLRQLLTQYSRVRAVTGGRSSRSPSTIVESLDGKFTIRITHNQVGPNPVGNPPVPRIHIFQGNASGHGNHVCLSNGTTLDAIMDALRMSR